MDDWELLEQFRTGRSQPAFAELVRRHAGFVYATCRRRVRDAHLAEDVAQAVFLVLARRPPTRSGAASLAGWLHRTAVYACHNAMRAEQIRQHHEREAAARRRERASPASPSELCVELEWALDAISPRDRDALLLRYYQGRDVAEVGQALGVSYNTAVKRLSRALDRLRRAMGARATEAMPATISAALLGMTRELPPPHLPLAIVRSVTAKLIGSSEAISASERIAEGVNHMIRQAHLKWTAAVTGAATFGAVALVAAGTLLAQQGTSSKKAAAPASQPAASVPASATAPAEAMGPKQVLHEFAAAVRAGDVEKLASLSQVKTEQDRQLLRGASAYVAATGSFQKAVKEKLGPDAAHEMSSLFELTPVGRFALLIDTTVDQAPEAVEGNVAMIQPADIPDLTFWLIKENGRWLLSCERMTEHWTPQQFDDRIGLMTMAADALNRFTENVEDGKYANVAELKRDLAPIVRQNR